MPVTPKRTCRTEEPFAEFDPRTGEFLRYQVFVRGAVPKFVIRDDEGRHIMDETAPIKDGAHTVEWPSSKPGHDWVWDGDDVHLFTGIMALVETYRIRLSACRANGSTKKVFRNCTFEKKKNNDVAFEFINVFVAEEE